MAKKKRKKPLSMKKKSKKSFTFRADPNLLEVLEEFAFSGDLIMGPKYDYKTATKTEWLHIGIHNLVWSVLGLEISEKQLEGYDGTPQICNLYIMFSRARRGVKGYGFTTKNKATRFVYGPPI